MTNKQSQQEQNQVTKSPIQTHSRIEDNSQQKCKNNIRLSTDGRIQTEGFFPTNNKLMNFNLTSDEFINYLHSINKSTIKITPNQLQPNAKNNQNNNTYIQSTEHQNTFIKCSNPKQAMIIPSMAQFMVSNNISSSIQNSNTNKLQNTNTNLNKSNHQNEINFIKNPVLQECNETQVSQEGLFQNQGSQNSKTTQGNSLSSTSSSSQQSSSNRQNFHGSSHFKSEDFSYSAIRVDGNQLDDEKAKALFTPEKSVAASGMKKASYYPQNHRQYHKVKRGSSQNIGSTINLSQQNVNTSLNDLPNQVYQRRYDFNYQKLLFEISNNNNQNNQGIKRYGKIAPAMHNPDYRNILDLDNSQNIINYYMRRNFSSNSNEVSESGKNLMISSLLSRNQNIRQTVEQYLLNSQLKFPDQVIKSSSQAVINIITAPNSETKDRKLPSSSHQKKRRNSGLVQLSQTTPFQQLFSQKNNNQSQQNGIIEVSQGNQCVAVFQNVGTASKCNQSAEKNENQQYSSSKKSSIKINNLHKTVDFEQDQSIQISKLISIEDKINLSNDALFSKNNKKGISSQSSSKDQKILNNLGSEQNQDPALKPKTYEIQLDKMNKILNYNNYPIQSKRPSTSFQNYNETIQKSNEVRKSINGNSSQDNINSLLLQNIQSQAKNPKNYQQFQQQNIANSPAPRQNQNLLRPSIDLSTSKHQQQAMQYQKQQQQIQQQQMQIQQVPIEFMHTAKTQSFIKNPPLITPQNQTNSLSVNTRSILYNYKQHGLNLSTSAQKSAHNQVSQNGKQKFNTEVSNSQSLEREIQINYFSNKKHRRRTNSQLNNENLFQMSKQDTINISITNMNQITEFSNQVTSKSGSKPATQNNKNISYSKQLMQIQSLQQNSINFIPPFTNLEIMNKLENAQHQQKDQCVSSSLGNTNSSINNYNKLLQKMVYR